MRKLTICFLLAIFCLSLTPVFALDYNPYDDDGISDTPATKEHPWDDYKYAADSTELKSNGFNQSGKIESGFLSIRSFFGLIKKYFLNGEGNEKESSKMPNSSKSSRPNSQR